MNRTSEPWQCAVTGKPQRFIEADACRVSISTSRPSPTLARSSSSRWKRIPYQFQEFWPDTAIPSESPMTAPFLKRGCGGSASPSSSVTASSRGKLTIFRSSMGLIDLGQATSRRPEIEGKQFASPPDFSCQRNMCSALRLDTRTVSLPSRERRAMLTHPCPNRPSVRTGKTTQLLLSLSVGTAGSNSAPCQMPWSRNGSTYGPEREFRSRSGQPQCLQPGSRRSNDDRHEKRMRPVMQNGLALGGPDEPEKRVLGSADTRITSWYSRGPIYSSRISWAKTSTQRSPQSPDVYSSLRAAMTHRAGIFR